MEQESTIEAISDRSPSPEGAGIDVAVEAEAGGEVGVAQHSADGSLGPGVPSRCARRVSM